MSSRSNHLGERVRQLRMQKGWSQSELAARLPHVKQQSIDQLEQGKVERPRFLPELADVLQTSVQWLLTGEQAIEKALPPQPAVDIALLRDVVLALDAALVKNGIELQREDQARLISMLYDLMQHEDGRGEQKMAEAADNIIRYERLIQ
jgi:transcriptional regulator with XRE-family HTH domain